MDGKASPYVCNRPAWGVPSAVVVRGRPPRRQRPRRLLLTRGVRSCLPEKVFPISWERWGLEELYGPAEPSMLVVAVVDLLSDQTTSASPSRSSATCSNKAYSKRLERN